jgi:DNA-binding LacI/PurR family transcriptional regulator
MKSKAVQRHKVGLREIARVAGVSAATVSRVLNGNMNVDPSLQEAVLGAASKLHVDLSQRNKTKALAFLLCNRTMLHNFHARILGGAEEYCESLGWDIVFLAYNYAAHIPWKELHLPRAIQRHGTVRAVILAGTNSMNLIELLEHKGVPFALLGNNVTNEQRDGKHDVVCSDDIQGSYEMTRYLISQGHRHICFVGNTRLPWFSRCFEGYQRAMEQGGLATRHGDIYSEDDTEIGYLSTKSLLAGEKPITAIFAGNDQTAHGVYKAIRDGGLRIPEDISVVGCNDTIGAWLYPALTTIREFPEEIGKRLAEVALNRIASPKLDAQRVTIPTELIKRDSCRSIVSAEDQIHTSTLQKLAALGS